MMKTETSGAAALQSGVGIIVGGLTLFAVVEVGKIFFGKRKVPLSPGTSVVVENQIITFGDEQIAWHDMFYRDSDRIEFRATTIKFGDQTQENASVVVTETTLVVNGQTYELA